MEFVQGRQEYCEEEEEEERQMIFGSLDMGKRPLHLSPSSSSLSPSSSSSQYKYVVPLSNGRWGAQIHDKHQRLILLGTYDTEEEASRAYDQVSIKFRGREAVTNFNRREPMELSDVAAEGDDGGIGSSGSGEREHMFDKVVTPSDVGKLNRLVIPKQHAEKYFPLDSAANEKGLLLNFEDRSGKPWRFRYSYWNSSQSYVMTKGWSRFVKDKKLDAGDIVSFERGVGESFKDCLYIDWKRRPEVPNSSSMPPIMFQHPLSLHHRSVAWGRLFLPPNISMNPQTHLQFQPLNFDHRRSYRSTYGNNAVKPDGSLLYLQSSVPQQVGLRGFPQPQGSGDGNMVSPMVIESVPVVHSKAAVKRVRLFGVNLDCPNDNYDANFLSTPMMRIPQAMTMTMASSTYPHPQLQPTLAPLPTPPSELPNKGKSYLSLDLGI